MRHMMPYYKSSTHVLANECFLIKVFKEVDINLSKEKDIEVPSVYDTYNGLSMNKIKFKKIVEGS